MGRAYVNGHLNTRFGACALEDEVEAILHVEVCKRSGDILASPAELILGRFYFVRCWQTVRLLCKALSSGKIEACLIDVDGDHTCRTVRFCEGASKKTDGADTEDEDGPLCARIEPCATGRMQENR